MTSVADLNKNMQILVVDDYPTVRRVVKNCLAKLGFKNVLEAENGEIALNVLKHNEVSIVISDWDMPKMKGKDLLEAVRADQKIGEIPFIMIVAEGQKRDLERSPVTANEEYVVKPFTTDTLQAKLEAAFTAK